MVKINVTPDSRFTRDGSDIRSSAKMSFTTATLGGVVEVETVHGRQTIKVSPGTQSGSTYRLRQKGVPASRTKSAGHHYVSLEVDVPKAVSKEQRELIQKLKL